MPRVKARTEIAAKIRRGRLEAEAALYPPSINAAVQRPRTHEDCGDLGGPLDPCPFVGCGYHLALDVDEATGSIRHNHPDKELWELEATCALKVADRGGVTNAEVGKLINVVREAAGIIINRACDKLKRRLPVYQEYVAGEVTRRIEPESEDVSGVRDALVRFLNTNDATYGDDAAPPALAKRPSPRLRRRRAGAR